MSDPEIAALKTQLQELTARHAALQNSVALSRQRWIAAVVIALSGLALFAPLSDEDGPLITMYGGIGGETQPAGAEWLLAIALGGLIAVILVHALAHLVLAGGGLAHGARKTAQWTSGLLFLGLLWGLVMAAAAASNDNGTDTTLGTWLSVASLLVLPVVGAMGAAVANRRASEAA